MELQGCQKLLLNTTAHQTAMLGLHIDSLKYTACAGANE